MSALIVDARTTLAYQYALRKIVQQAEDRFFRLMQMSVGERNEWFAQVARSNGIANEVLMAWTQSPQDPNENWEEQTAVFKIVVDMLIADAKEAFSANVQEVIDKILKPEPVPTPSEAVPVLSDPVPEPVATEPPSPEPYPTAPTPPEEPPQVGVEGEAYPAPDTQTMALDPVNEKGEEIPPLQTRNLYTLPKHERAKLMPTKSVDADDTSWLNNSVYNKE